MWAACFRNRSWALMWLSLPVVVWPPVCLVRTETTMTRTGPRRPRRRRRDGEWRRSVTTPRTSRSAKIWRNPWKRGSTCSTTLWKYEFPTERQNSQHFQMTWTFFDPAVLRLTLLLCFQQRKENGTIDGADKEILAEAERLDVKAMGPLILSELLFNENIREQIKKYKRHFLRVRWTMLLSYVCVMMSNCAQSSWPPPLYLFIYFLCPLSSATTTRRPRSICWEGSSVWWSCIRSSCCLVFPSSSKTFMTPTCWRKTSYSPGQRRCAWSSLWSHDRLASCKLGLGTSTGPKLGSVHK